MAAYKAELHKNRSVTEDESPFTAKTCPGKTKFIGHNFCFKNIGNAIFTVLSLLGICVDLVLLLLYVLIVEFSLLYYC